jgi:CHASE3 domain sensor protein
MEQLTFQNPNNDEKALTLKSLEKQVNTKFTEYENKIKILERKIEVVKQAVRGNYGK